MDLQLEGKKALVTGSTAGIGLAIATALAREGADVVINGRTDARVAEAMHKIREHARGSVSGVAADSGTRAGADRLIAQVPAVDVLVNNLGIFEPKSFADIPDEDWQRMFATNVLSGVRLTRHYGPRMREKKFGRVVFISSESGVQIPTDMIHYGFTKSADLALMRGFAQALAATGVTVNAVLPGPTRTEGVEAMFRSMGVAVEGPDAERKFIESGRPSSIIKRLASAQEVADVVVFLCSREASAITGSPVRADGGIVMSIT